MKTISDFESFMKKLDCKINKIYSHNPTLLSPKTTPTDFEKIVTFAITDIISKESISATVEYTEGGHSFPDIVIKFYNGQTLGVEVKSSVQPNSKSNNWQILGNSILGSTRIPVTDLYIYFIKINKNGFFTKYNRYENSVIDIAVTHSPRYKIDLSISPEESFF